MKRRNTVETAPILWVKSVDLTGGKFIMTVKRVTVSAQTNKIVSIEEKRIEI